MNKKEKLVRESAVEMERMWEASRGKIKDRFPNVESIIIKCQFYDDSGNRLEHKNIFEWKDKERYASFKIKCDYCFDGATCGYDLSSIVSNMVRNKESEISGTEVCSGLLRELGHYHCLRTLKYKINIEYKNY